MTILFRAVFLLLAALFVSAADAPPAAAPSATGPTSASPAMAPAGTPSEAGVVAQRGDVRLTEAELKDVLSQLDPTARAQIMASSASLANFARERVLNMAVLAEAKAKKWDTQPDIVRRMNEARDAVIMQTYLASLVPPDPAFPSEAEITTAYENNKSHLVMPRQYHIAQIVLAVKAGASPQEDEEVHKKALDLRAQAMRPKADFAELARKNSQETQSADKGGDVGWLREPDMIPAVREAVAGMVENGISQPVRVPDGWHLLKLLALKPAGEVPLSDAKPQFVTALRQARVQRMMRAYLDEMLKAQPIQLNEIELTKELGTAK